MEKLISSTSLSEVSSGKGTAPNGRYAGDWFVISFRELKDDLKRTRWLRFFGWFWGFIWISGLATCACVVGIMSLSSTDSACQPDGSFRLRPESYNMWSSSGFFQITLGSGHLTFAQAKVIDIIWDIAVGRGGQFLLAYVSLEVFRYYLTTCMNVRPITYQMFRSVFLQNDISLPSAYGITKGFLCQQPLRSNVAMAFMITTMGFIIAFPTLASAMSGYDANVGSYIPDYDQNFVPFSNFSQLLYVIHDGWRINETGKFWVVDNYTWPYYAYGYADPVLPAYEYSTCLTYGPDMGSFPPQCALAAAISNYTQQYGFGGRNNVSSTFNHSGIVTLDAPTLNIEAFAKAGDDKLRRLKPTDPILPQSWLKGNESYDITYVQENGSCQTIGDYQWGFSFLQLFICILLLLMWTVGTYILWLRAHFTFKLRGWDFNQVSGEHKAVLELAKAMQEDLDIKSSHCSLLIEKHLKERIDKELSGGSFSYSPAYPELKGYSFRRGTKTWIKQNIWWFVAIMASTVFCGVGWMAHAMVWIWNFGLWVGLLLAVCIGTSNGSRILITLFWSTLGVIGVIPLSIMMA